MDSLIGLVILLMLMSIGYCFGSIDQRRHYRALREREKHLGGILLFNERTPPQAFSGQEFSLVCGSVVIGCDYFRQVMGSLKALVGGRLTSFEAMLDRGRREAILRMKEEAQRMGATAIFNVRLETSTLAGKDTQGLTCVELIAYGTAWRAPAKTST